VMNHARFPKLVSISGFSLSSGPKCHWEYSSGSDAVRGGTEELQQHVRRPSTLFLAHSVLLQEQWSVGFAMGEKDMLAARTMHSLLIHRVAVGPRRLVFEVRQAASTYCYTASRSWTQGSQVIHLERR
jgi:hypothetical protein